uniref:Vomeronasal type-1 receptor n=1 Tax=Otolemur garnettii TaxID=30611 RepID=H0XWM4_OTOGA
MASGDLAIGMIFLLQTIAGILGNFSLLYHYLFLDYTERRLRSTDLIVTHLTVANCLVILSKGVPQTMAVLGLKDFLSDVGCKLLFYLHRVGRDVSIGTTCHLSIFQAIMIIPRNSRCAELKQTVHKYVGISSILCWVLCLVLNSMVPLYVTGKGSNKNITRKIDYGYCYIVLIGKVADLFYAALVLPRDALGVVLTLWASSSMVFILYRHRQRIQYIHGNNRSPRSSPESTATQSILVLVSTIVSLCVLSSIFHICLIVFSKPKSWLANISAFIAVCFSAVTPYILWSQHSRPSRLGLAC